MSTSVLNIVPGSGVPNMVVGMLTDVSAVAMSVNVANSGVDSIAGGI